MERAPQDFISMRFAGMNRERRSLNCGCVGGGGALGGLMNREEITGKQFNRFQFTFCTREPLYWVQDIIL